MKRQTIKKMLVAVAVATATNICFAQTPFDSFAPPKEEKPMLKLKNSTFVAYNNDTTSESKYIEFDKELLTVSYYNQNDSLLKTVKLDVTALKFISVDPHAESYPNTSPYCYVNNNPILNIDPDGRDWFKYTQEGADEASWNWHDGSTYEHKTGVDADGNDVFETLQGHQAVVIFNGSMNEKLGKGQNLFGEGAILANVTVYGPGGADDIEQYQGFTMSSDFEKWGAVADGSYQGNFDARGKSGALKSNYTINNRWKVPALGGVNPSPHRDFVDSKTGIFIHASNKSGFAGNYTSKRDGQLHGISEGCLLIVPTQYDIQGNVISTGFDQFNSQMQGASNFLLELNRTR